MKSKIQAALIALILASAGGAAFLHHNPNPTLRDVFLSCEKGELSGIACCEDMNKVEDWRDPLKSCGMITPKNHDPFGVRILEENKFDQDLKEGK